ncbi:related to oxidoreductase [Cephalotrichum gorgonifer]|uniref:Related to oxidoreductase n=1 Tax=Cephalotrichum gorgonifer TaxID=2041049 RepID=A0AAE8N2Q7_9PEZI|nr:related to oxidoreductase [Cephalotrichum gorgonifer]
MKSLLNLSFLALALAASVRAIQPDELAQRGSDVVEDVLAPIKDGAFNFDDALEDTPVDRLTESLDAINLLDDDHPEPTLTIYQLISEHPHTTKFAYHLSQHDDLVEILNNTEGRNTLFVPADEAFDHLPFKEHPPEEWIRSALEYHIATHVYTAHDLIRTNTMPTVLKEEWLGGKPQRLRASLTLGGLHINFLSKVIVPNTRATNGIIHTINRVAFPPTMVGRELSLLPNHFSTLLLAYEKTDFVKFIHGVKMEGSTVFAPTNQAFAKLGPRANAFLFNSDKGKVILKALLKYQIVANVTLYSDARYGSTGEVPIPESGKHYHYDLKTLLQEKHVSVDVNYFGPFVKIKVNGQTPVVARDVVAKNGVIQVVGRVPLPPHKHHDGENESEDEEISVDDLVERLSDYIDEEDLRYDGEL